MPTNAYLFECSAATYLDCVQKGLFASNLPWPLQIKKGDHCCLYHYEVSTLFALWRADSDAPANDGTLALGERAFGHGPFYPGEPGSGTGNASARAKAGTNQAPSERDGGPGNRGMNVPGCKYCRTDFTDPISRV
jgi:hypothetical protein